MGINGYKGVCMGIKGYTWVHIGINRYKGVYMGIMGYTWV